jgi:hypothetical protein
VLLALLIGVGVGLWANSVSVRRHWAPAPAVSVRTRFGCCGIDGPLVITRVGGRPLIVAQAEHIDYLALLSRLLGAARGTRLRVRQGPAIVLRAAIDGRGKLHAWVSPRLLHRP